jgi:hypothetical protein
MDLSLCLKCSTVKTGQDFTLHAIFFRASSPSRREIFNHMNGCFHRSRGYNGALYGCTSLQLFASERAGHPFFKVVQ